MLRPSRYLSMCFCSDKLLINDPPCVSSCTLYPFKDRLTEVVSIRLHTPSNGLCRVPVLRTI